MSTVRLGRKSAVGNALGGRTAIALYLGQFSLIADEYSNLEIQSLTDDSAIDADHLLHLTAEIVAAYVMHNAVSAIDLPGLIASTSAALGRLALPVEEAAPVERQKPAVPISKSITADYLISLEDGLKFKSLKRPLRARYGLTPEQYREKWRLPADYPMVAPNYSVTRSALAKANGLGRKPKVDPALAVEPAKPARKKLGLNFGKSTAST